MQTILRQDVDSPVGCYSGVRCINVYVCIASYYVGCCSEDVRKVPGVCASLSPASKTKV